MRAAVSITYPDGTIWALDDIETSYGDEPLYLALRQLADDKDPQGELGGRLQKKIRAAHATAEGDLSLRPGDQWHAEDSGYVLTISA
jgi:hypothetical protein